MTSRSPLRILLVDDAPEAEAFVAHWLQADVPSVHVHRVPNAAEFSEALAADGFDVVITEAHTSWADGLDVLRSVKEQQPSHPVLMLTGQGDEDLAVSALQAGFDAYLRKGPDQGGRLAAAITSALEAARERAARRRAEQALVASEARHRAILEAAVDTIVSFDESGRIESVNPAVSQMFGYLPSDLIGRPFGTLLGEMPDSADYPRSGGSRREAADMLGTSGVVTGRRADGTTFPLDLAISEIRIAGRRVFTAIMRDITERRRAEAERIVLLDRERAAVNEWRREATVKSLILENMADAVFVTDPEGRYVLVNAAGGRLLDMDPQDLVGVAIDDQRWQTFTEAGEPIRREDRPIVRALRGERASMVQRLRTLDNREVIVRASSAPIRNESGQIVGVVHVVHDMTEDYARARHIAQGARLRSLGQLAGGVAHDLNQYLGLVVGYGDLTLESLDKPTPDLPGARESLTTMIRAAIDGGEAVRRLLLFARPGTEGPASRIELDDLLREVAKFTAPRWRDAAQQQGRQISVEVAVEGTVAIDGWASDLREAITNLVFNAVDALPGGGMIRMVARSQDNKAIVEVADTGSGMDAATRERLFEPFFTTKDEGGSGLGLPIVFGIVERHNGTIDVESQPGEGSTFRLVFPSAAHAETQRPTMFPEDVTRRLRILVVDDEPALVTMLARLLSSDGHDVVTATSGEEAVTILVGTEVDVVISDLGMGAGMNGWELAAAVRAQEPRPHFILTTGWGAEIDPDEAAQRGVAAVVSKPYRLPDLRRILNTM